ncbi:MAG: WbqC family protein [Saprospiraceae bacterium]|nr:WbqC family protein [Saprospiraceae bacterium]
MEIAIIQPYLFPYIGYFQLMEAVDVFVMFDDIQYIKGGWINRNRINSKNGQIMFTLPLVKESHKELINERFIDMSPIFKMV